MKDVKAEIYGTRKSHLSKIFQKAGTSIDFIDSIWVITCRRSINSNCKSRYLIFIESNHEFDYSIFKNYINIYKIFFKGKSLDLVNIKTNNISTFYTKDDLKNWILSITDCKYIPSYAPGKNIKSKLSKFFRENMGKGFSMTDIDYYLPTKNIFIEEKSFQIKNKGYIGEGQLYSYLELKSDICLNSNVVILTFIDENRLYVTDIKKINIYNKKILNKWGRMIEFDLGKQINSDELIEFLK